MPHCDTCERFYNPNTIRPDGTCPGCDERLAEPLAPFEREGAPWHFKLLVTATVVYLGWRLVEGLIWVAERL